MRPSQFEILYSCHYGLVFCSVMFSSVLSYDIILYYILFSSVLHDIILSYVLVYYMQLQYICWGFCRVSIILFWYVILYVCYHPLVYYILCFSILSALGPSWVGFRLLPRARKLFSGFDCLEKRLIYYVSYYVKVQV